MTRLGWAGRAAALSTLIVAALAGLAAGAFTYKPVGQLLPGSGEGYTAPTVFAPGMRFPIQSAPAYANSQVYGTGGLYGPTGGQCAAANYAYPWRDNYCENRQWTMPLCPAGIGHQGQDIRPSTCEKNVHPIVAADDGTITSIGTYTMYVQAGGTSYRYGHMDISGMGLYVGKPVARGEVLGYVSNEFGGTPTSIHLHFDIKQNVANLGSIFVSPYLSLVAAYEELLGQGGTVATEYVGEFVSQTHPVAAETIVIAQGETAVGTLTLKNVGSKPWTPGATRLAPMPRDQASPLAASDWISPTRVSAPAQQVAPGQTAVFQWNLTGQELGTQTHYFGLVQESVTWFADTPLGGGPPDDLLAVTVQVVPGCTPDCAGKDCGPDGCGASCGSCADGTVCTAGVCACVPDCAGKLCGPDGCGGSCGGCGAGMGCQDGACVCVPQCEGKACGLDGCGGSCGACAAGTTCSGGLCVCNPQCGGQACGPDGCGGTCGACPAGTTCSGGLCVCNPQCGGKACGPDGCGGSCGTCPVGHHCNTWGQCASGSCAPSCDHADGTPRRCGDDGCGGTCGACAEGEACVDGACCVGADCSDPLGDGGAPEVGSGATAASPADGCRGAGGGPAPWLALVLLVALLARRRGA